MAEKLNPNANPQTEISDEQLDNVTGGFYDGAYLPCPDCRSDKFLTKNNLMVFHCNNCGCNFINMPTGGHRILSYTK